MSSLIDDQKFEDFFQSLRRYVSASDERWERRAFFEYPYLFPNSFSVNLDDGRKVSVVRRGKFQWSGEEYNDITVSEHDGVAYIRVPSFHLPKFEEATVQAVQRFEGAKVIVVDVRGNHGGSTPSDLIAKLMDRPYRWFGESTPVNMGLFKYRGDLGAHADLYWYGDVEQPDKTPYRGIVYILVDSGCFSACEDFVEPFKDNHRVTIIGERTAGSSGQPFSKDFGNGMGIGLSTKREFLPDTSEFEGVGIAPDVEVQTSADDLRRKNDPVLEKVQMLIREQLRK
jgi:carboxyl-terminal processing protease